MIGRKSTLSAERLDEPNGNQRTGGSDGSRQQCFSAACQRERFSLDLAPRLPGAVGLNGSIDSGSQAWPDTRASGTDSDATRFGPGTRVQPDAEVRPLPHAGRRYCRTFASGSRTPWSALDAFDRPPGLSKHPSNKAVRLGILTPSCLSVLIAGASSATAKDNSRVPQAEQCPRLSPNLPTLCDISIQTHMAAIEPPAMNAKTRPVPVLPLSPFSPCHRSPPVC